MLNLTQINIIFNLFYKDLEHHITYIYLNKHV